MRTYLPHLLVAIACAGCSATELTVSESDYLDGEMESPGAIETDDAQNTRNFWVEVKPIDTGGLLVPPQIFGPLVSGDGFVHELLPAITIAGNVGAIAVTEWLTPVPGESVAAEANLFFVSTRTGAAMQTRTNAFGNFTIDLVPDDYQVTTTPSNVSVPTRTEFLTLAESSRVDVVLDRGVPLWGQVLDGTGAPIAGAAVWAAASISGATSENVYSDAQGWYELRVAPGIWSVHTAGDAGVKTPTIGSVDLEVGDDGLRSDLRYAEGDAVALELRVVDAKTGNGIADAPITITASSVFGYPNGTAGFMAETDTDNNGFVISKVPPGIYDISIAPDADQRWGAITLEDQPLQFATTLSATALVPFETVAMEVVDEDGIAIADTIVRCEENAGGKREWIETTDKAGLVAFELPPQDLTCLLSPPEGSNLAVTQIRVDKEFPSTVTLTAGTLISNSAVVAGPDGQEPAAFALVRLTDTDGNVWGSTLTDENGDYALRVDFSRVSESEPTP